MKKQYLNTEYYVTKEGDVIGKYGRKLSPIDTGVKLVVNLIVDGKRKRESVSRLIAITFLDNPDNKGVAGHIDKNYQNVSADNLIWATREEVCRLYSKRPTHTRKVVGDDGTVYLSINEAANAKGVSKTTIRNWCRNEVGSVRFLENAA